MKRIAIYDRYKLDNGEIPELQCGIKATFMNEEVTSEQLLNSPVMIGIGDAIEQKMGM